MEDRYPAWSYNAGDAHMIEGGRLGTIAGKNENGQFLVDFRDNIRGPLEARITTSAHERLKKGNPVGKEVLFLFQDSDPAQPIIMDVMYSALDDTLEQSVEQNTERSDEATVDGKRITLNANDEIVLRCGEASITLTKEGKVVIQGEYVLNRSFGVNKIEGSSIRIN